MTERAVLPTGAKDDRALSGVGRYTDVEALALAIVHALEDRDSGLVAEVDALRCQVSALATMADRALSPMLDVSAIETLSESQPELRRELSGVVEHLLDSARNGSPAAPTTTALLLLTLPLTQALTRRHDQLEVEIRALRQDVSALCEEVSNLNHSIFQSQGRQPAATADVNAMQSALRVELAPLRQQLTALDRAGELAALRSQLTELGERLTSTQPAGLSAPLQDAIRSDLARLIERLNHQSRTEQVVALREEVRAQLGTLDQAAELRSLRLMISAELAQLRGQSSANGIAHRPTPGSTNGHTGPALGTSYRTPARRDRGRVGNIHHLLRTLRQGSDELHSKMADLRKRGRRRAVIKTGDPDVVVSGPAALLLGVADLLDESDTP